ncbi:hypothetical protein Bca4012_054671 [Brassica carinata]
MVRFVEENTKHMEKQTGNISNTDVTTVKKNALQDLSINNGGGLINSWVDSMRACSPTHLKSLMKQSSWLTEHPSALDMFEEILHVSEGKQIVMFLDYDGTLSPIVDDPDRAFMSKKVYNFVKLTELYYAGSHGMDIKGPAQGSKYKEDKSLLCQPATEFLPMIDEVYQKLVEKTKVTPGANVENNKFCASVHFRRVDEKNWSDLANQVRSVIKEYPELRITQGRKVLEIRPIIKWDKGKALEFLLESLGYANCTDVFPIYIGDDRTDEDAFKETNASYSLQEPDEVMNFLQRLVEWKQLRSSA